MSEPSPRRLMLWVALIVAIGALGVWLAWEVVSEQNQRKNEGQAAKAPDTYWHVSDFEFTDQDGRPFGTKQLAGKVWVACFFFTQCSGTCPQMAAQLQRLQNELLGMPVKLVSITCDPKNDTPERLRAYAKQYEADPERWVFLTGNAESIQDFSRKTLKLGLQQANPKQLAEGQERIIHSQRFVLIDDKGDVRGFYDGIDEMTVGQLSNKARELAANIR